MRNGHALTSIKGVMQLFFHNIDSNEVALSRFLDLEFDGVAFVKRLASLPLNRLVVNKYIFPSIALGNKAYALS